MMPIIKAILPVRAASDAPVTTSTISLQIQTNDREAAMRMIPRSMRINIHLLAGMDIRFRAPRQLPKLFTFV